MGKAAKDSGGCARHLTGGVRAGAGPAAGRGFRLPEPLAAGYVKAAAPAPEPVGLRSGFAPTWASY